MRTGFLEKFRNLSPAWKRELFFSTVDLLEPAATETRKRELWKELTGRDEEPPVEEDE